LKYSISFIKLKHFKFNHFALRYNGKYFKKLLAGLISDINFKFGTQLG